LITDQAVAIPITTVIDEAMANPVQNKRDHAGIKVEEMLEQLPSFHTLTTLQPYL